MCGAARGDFMASHRIAPAPALVSSFSARCACGYTPENAPRSSRSSRNSPGHFFAKALLRGKTGRGPDDGIGSAEWGEPGPPLSASGAGAVRAASRCALTIRSPRRAPAVPETASPLPRAPPPPRRREKPPPAVGEDCPFLCGRGGHNVEACAQED